MLTILYLQHVIAAAHVSFDLISFDTPKAGSHLLFAVPCYITASDDCAHVFLSVGTGLFFLWAMEKGESISKDRDAELKGNWHKVMTPSGMELPNTESRENSLAGIFYTSPVSRLKPYLGILQ